MSRILSGSRQDHLSEAAALLSNGGLVALPTETVYGLAANALDTQAVAQVFSVKGRPLLDPLIVHVRDLAHAHDFADIPPSAHALAQAFWPGPLTLVLPKKSCVPDTVTAGKPTVALRSPAHPVMRAVLEQCGLGLAAPSANPFGYISPTTAQHVQDSLGTQTKLTAIVDGGACEHGLESTIVDLSNPEHPTLLRPGPIDKDSLERVLGTVYSPSVPSDDHAPQAAPGMLSQHYSPRTPMHLCANPNEVFTQDPSEHTALLYLCKPPASILDTLPPEQTFWCTEGDNLREAAHNLFALMRKLDGMSYAHIIAQSAPDSGIGTALNNRLTRAAQNT